MDNFKPEKTCFYLPLKFSIKREDVDIFFFPFFILLIYLFWHKLFLQDKTRVPTIVIKHFIRSKEVTMS